AAEMLVDTVRTLPSPTAQTITLGCGEVGEFGWQNPFGGLAQNGIVLLCRKSIRELFMPHSFCRTGALDRRRKWVGLPKIAMSRGPPPQPRLSWWIPQRVNASKPATIVPSQYRNRWAMVTVFDSPSGMELTSVRSTLGSNTITFEA